MSRRRARNRAEPACPCGTPRPYPGCCGRFHAGEQTPATPEELMRSRYSAFVVRDAGYLRRTWDESTCPAVVDLSDDVDWLGLDIVDAPAPGPFHNTATVAFVARYRRAGARSAMAETSLFRRTAGGWRYVRPVVTTD